MDKGTFALVEGSMYTEYINVIEPHAPSYFVAEKIYPTYLGWVFQKGTPWKYMFDRYVFRVCQKLKCIIFFTVRGINCNRLIAQFYLNSMVMKIILCFKLCC